MNYYIGIDLGGTFIKGGAVGKNGKIIRFESVATRVSDGAEIVLSDIESLIEKLINGLKGRLMGIGIGVPGLVDGKKEAVVLAPNINWENVPVTNRLKEKFGCKVAISNDANVAGLGEAKFGNAKKYKTCVFLTLGTGVGSAIIIDGKLFEGNASAGAEIGHMIIEKGGRKCACGNRGCFETYASATALIKDTVEAMKNDPSSKMWSVGDIEKVDGKTAFSYYNEDATAKKVVDNYLNNLAVGVINVANIFRPEAIILGGGISKEGSFLSESVQKLLDKNIYAIDLGPRVEVMLASVKEAGVVGAASLNM